MENVLEANIGGTPYEVKNLTYGVTIREKLNNFPKSLPMSI